ncbi:Csp1 family four helix bundle copper storage protein [Methylocystis heyeri]|nr:Csp1 family four helix bundle copper storage protein [Methylocystis heyeri]
MKRRSFIAGIGAAAYGSSALAGQAPAVPAAAAPAAPRKPYKTLAETSAKCLEASRDCLRKSFERLSAKDPSLADCASLASEVAAACAALEALAGTGAPFAVGFARTAADLCLACKKECEKFPQIAECLALGAACRTCAEECRKAAG